MDNLATIFQFAPTAILHRDRTRAIHDILNAPPTATELTQSAVGYAVAHHFLEGTERAARAADRNSFEWYRAHLTRPPAEWFHPDAHGTTITQSATPSTLVSSPLAETPYYLLGPDTAAARASIVELATAAKEIAADCGFGELVSQHAAITLLLVERNFDEPLNSWTITRLPGTVFVDHVNDPTILARDLIHEAGHNWLNDALTAAGIRIDDKHSYWSPWKQARRPTFGYLHSCWAFPLTMIFAARAIPAASEQVSRVLSAYLAQHRRQLAETAAEYERALAAVTDETIRHDLCQVYEAARQL